MFTPSQALKRPAAPVSRIAGRYELQEKLGEGGMGVVWRAQDIKTGGQVAIKIMKDVSDPAAVELFAREWRTLAELCHPNIVDVRDVDVLEEHRERKPFFVMPLLRGATLGELIAGGSARLTVARMVEIVSQVCRGLQAAHEMGLVHRDLKPSNIFVMNDDTAKIIDFGVVYLAGSHSVTGQKGTFQYMSPEQVQMKEITPTSDIFALGVILYEGLTGRKPFACATAEETMRAVLKQIPPAVSEINGSIPQAIGRVVHKCLAKSPIHRFSSAREVSEMLGKALRGEPVFDDSKLQPRIERIKAALRAGDESFASEMLAEVEAEGQLDPEITLLRMQIDMAMKQKKIRQLFEGVRARIEQDEIPLALDKLRELLELDPENADALALREQTEKRRSEAQIGKWLILANTHLGNRDFAAARHAVGEVLKTRVGDERALDLMQQIDTAEAESRRIREQKEQLYHTALKSYQNGEIDAALTKLARLLFVVQSKPEGAVPELDAVYDRLYKEVRSEHDSIQARLEEAQHLFSEKNFTKAMALCTDHLLRFPSDRTFQALKIQIEDAERQEVSAYIASVFQSVEAEPDLDRRVNILREASERYPAEMQFAQQLKVVRERRDLVNAIVAKARQLEEQANHADALSQWDTLKNIHPRYPGLAFELEQCKKKRDRLAAEEEKNRLVEEIVGFLDARAFQRAIDRARMALAEYPADTELVGLEKLATVGLERSQDARRLFEEGQVATAEKDWPRASDLLRSALRLDPRNPSIRDAMVNVLTEQARIVVEDAWPEAEKLCHEAEELDPSHRSVRALQALIRETKRQSYVGECLTMARALVATNDYDEALKRIRIGREEYPKDSRLEQFEVNLLKQTQDRRRTDERERKLEELNRARRSMEANPDSANVRHLVDVSNSYRSKYVNDPNTERIVADAEASIRRVTHLDDLTGLFAGTVAYKRPPARVIQDDAVTPTPQARPADASAMNDETLLFPAAGEREALPPKAKRSWPAAGSARGAVAQWPRSRVSGTALGLAGAGVATLVAIVLLITLGGRHQKPQPVVVHTALHNPAPPPPATKLHLALEPSDSSATVNGIPVPGNSLSIVAGGSAVVDISRAGYKSRSVQLSAASNPRIVLEPEPVHVSVQTGGPLQLDGRRISEADALDGVDVPADGQPHTLTVADASQQISKVEFQAAAGALPHINALHAKDLLAVSSLGSSATVYGGDSLKSVQLGSQHIAVTAAGTGLPPLTAGTQTLRYGSGDDAGSLSLDITPTPLLIVRSLVAESQMTVTSNVPAATLTMDGEAQKPQRHGWRLATKPGTYNFVLTAEGYEPQTWTTTLHRHEQVPKAVSLVKRVIVPVATSSALSIARSTPNAEVKIDGKQVGLLDGNGAGQFAKVLLPGRHELTLEKPGLCGTLAKPIQANPPNEVILADLKLDACGKVYAHFPNRTVNAQYRAKGEGKWTQLAVGLQVSLSPGAYELTANTTGYPTYAADFTVEPGKLTDVPLKFAVPQSCQLQDPSQATSDGESLKAKNSGSFLYLRSGCMNVQISFNKPKTGIMSGFRGGKHVQWEIVSPDGRAHIQYALDDQKITRRVVIGRETTDARDANTAAGVDSKGGGFAIRISVDGPHVHVASEHGETLDDYVATAPSLHDLSGGRIGLKTNAPFTPKGIGE